MKPAEIAKPPKKVNLLMSGLRKTRAILTADIGDLLAGKKRIDANTLEELETRLLMADVGIAATQAVIEALTKKLSYGEIDTVDTLIKHLSELLIIQLEHIDSAAQIQTEYPLSILIVGVNGSGKTTSIGKLAQHFQSLGKKVMLAAGDTFRAAAVEQLKTWGERNQVQVIAQDTGADPASVIFDALQSAKAKNIDVLLADTAGRLHTQDNLMEELKKIKRVMQKVDAHAPHETWLVIDGGVGQNALQQARQFHNAIGLSGLIITKLDGTAKGGIVFSIYKELKLPVKFIGVGEDIEDLREFNAKEFVNALLNKTD